MRRTERKAGLAISMAETLAGAFPHISALVSAKKVWTPFCGIGAP